MPALLFITGASGPRGFDGIGQPGNQGFPGKPGPQGDPGKRGNQGPPGICDISMCYQTYDLGEHYRKGPNMWRWVLRGQYSQRLVQNQQDFLRSAMWVEDRDCGSTPRLTSQSGSCNTVILVSLPGCIFVHIRSKGRFRWTFQTATSTFICMKTSVLKC